MVFILSLFLCYQQNFFILLMVLNLNLILKTLLAIIFGYQIYLILLNIHTEYFHLSIFHQGNRIIYYFYLTVQIYSNPSILLPSFRFSYSFISTLWLITHLLSILLSTMLFNLHLWEYSFIHSIIFYFISNTRLATFTFIFSFNFTFTFIFSLLLFNIVVKQAIYLQFNYILI
jgi:hypothetical protein